MQIKNRRMKGNITQKQIKNGNRFITYGRQDFNVCHCQRNIFPLGLPYPSWTAFGFSQVKDIKSN